MTMAGASRPSREMPFSVGPWRVRGLGPWDLPQVAGLEARLFPEPLACSGLLVRWVHPGTCYLGACSGRQVLAYIGFHICGPAAHTISMGVHPDHRRRGLATLMQRTADQIALARGARWFTGEVRVSNVGQLQFLDGLGWERIGVCPRFFGNGEDAVVVWNWLG